jgi:murein DD-endopeptidase MepM/ murein hydrolase activator NlpD
MLSRRYTVLLADRTTGVVHRFTISLRPALLIVGTILALPILIGLGARWSASAEIAQLRTARAGLVLENESYRAATGELTAQISSLQAAVTELGEQAALDPAAAKAMNNLPALLRARARGGVAQAGTSTLLSSALSTPESTFGVLRDLLGVLESHLQIARHGVERQQALAAAIPAIWPAHGWLSSAFGRRSDPFTGDPDFHSGLDISTSRGAAVYATADGRVVSAAYSGNYGNLVVIEHGFGIVTRYAHLSRFAVKPGARVSRGEVIGYVGATGRATAPHLHYEVLVNGRIMNPLRLLTARPSAAVAN